MEGGESVGEIILRAGDIFQRAIFGILLSGGQVRSLFTWKSAPTGLIYRSDAHLRFSILHPLKSKKEEVRIIMIIRAREKKYIVRMEEWDGERERKSDREEKNVGMEEWDGEVEWEGKARERLSKQER